MENNEKLIFEISRFNDLINFDYSDNGNNISEQLSFKKNKLVWGGKDKIEPGKIGRSDSKKFKENLTIIPKEQWDTFLANDTDMVNLMQTNYSKNNWKKLKSDPNKKEYAVYALNQFRETYPEKKWNSVYVAHIASKQQGPPPKSEPRKYPGILITFPDQNNQSAQYFVDNNWDLTENFKNVVQENLIKPIQEQMINVPQQLNPKAGIVKLEIYTSCSRLPNGTSKDGKIYSFEQLSEKRNITAKEYVIGELQKIGVVISPNLQPLQDWKGKNKDGTSGPNWDSNWPQTTKDAKRPQYEQYKYLMLNVGVAFNSLEIGGGEVPDQEQKPIIQDSEYNVTFRRKSKEITLIKLPKIRFNKPRRGNVIPRSWSKDECTGIFRPFPVKGGNYF